jgi:TetR/AcrR family transcriptional repressor of nem operon
MRYPAGHKERTHRRIVASAARRFREKGYRGAGVDDVMAASGLTAGAFYAHFPSKEALLAETLELSLRQTRERLLLGLESQSGVEWLLELVRRYLSRSHRDAPADGCALPALSPDVARQGPAPRATLERHLVGLVDELALKTPAGPGLSPRERLLATLALGAGGLMLARAVEDESLSNEILRACRRLAVPEAVEERVPVATGPRTDPPPGAGEVDR